MKTTRAREHVDLNDATARNDIANQSTYQRHLHRHVEAQNTFGRNGQRAIREYAAPIGPLQLTFDSVATVVSISI